MNPDKAKRDQVHRLTDLPNIGPAMVKDIELIGINRPDQLTGQDPLRLYERLCLERGVRQDPCVLDNLIGLDRRRGFQTELFSNRSAQTQVGEFRR